METDPARCAGLHSNVTNDRKVGPVGVGKALLAEKLPKDRSSKGLIPEYAPCIPLLI